MSSLQVPLSSHDHFLGPLDAPLTLVEYGDYQCPYCAKAHQELKPLLAAMQDELLFVYRHFPLTELHEFAFLGAMSAEAAGLQGRFWDMHDLLYEHQEELEPRGVERLASDLGLDLLEFQRQLDDEALMSRIRKDFLGGIRSGVNGTPTFYLNRESFNRPLDVTELRQGLRAA